MFATCIERVISGTIVVYLSIKFNSHTYSNRQVSRKDLNIGTHGRIATISHVRDRPDCVKLLATPARSP